MRLRKAPADCQRESKEVASRRVYRIHCHCLTIKCNGLICVRRSRNVARCSEDQRILWGNSQSGLYCFIGALPSVIEVELDHRANKQCLRQVRLERQCPNGCFTRCSEMTVETRPSQCGCKIAEPNMRLSQTGPAKRESGIELYRPFISSQGFTLAFFRISIAIKAALQILLVSRHIFCPTLFRHLYQRLNCGIRSSARKLAAQFSDDGLGKLGLHREYVLQITRVVFRPDLLAGVGASEPGRDADDVARFAHASLDQMRHA